MQSGVAMTEDAGLKAFKHQQEDEITAHSFNSIILLCFDVFIMPNECDISVLYRHSALFLYIFVHNIYI